MSVEIFFVLLAVIIFVGFAGNVLFERTRIPDVLILIAIGVLLGPATNIFPNEWLRDIAPYFGALALVMILFEGGLELEFRKTISQVGWALLLVVVSFGLSMAGVASYLWYTNSLDLSKALLLGAIVGCTSGPIIIPLVSHMRLSDRVKSILSVESALSDALAILVTILLARAFGSGMHSVDEVFRMFIPAMATGVFVGVLAGLGWLYVLEIIKKRPLSYVLTFATLLLLYALVESTNGSGALAVLTFGMILGNDDVMARWLGLRAKKPAPEAADLKPESVVQLEAAWGIKASAPTEVRTFEDPDQVIHMMLRWFHGELSFIIRTFFFVFLGMLIEFSFFDLQGLLVGSVVFMIILVTRWISVHLVRLHGDNPDQKRHERTALMVMIPRGLACAVLATHPAVVEVTGPTVVLSTTFVIIVLTNIFMVIGIPIVERMKGAEQTS